MSMKSLIVDRCLWINCEMVKVLPQRTIDVQQFHLKTYMVYKVDILDTSEKLVALWIETLRSHIKNKIRCCKFCIKISDKEW